MGVGLATLADAPAIRDLYMGEVNAGKLDFWPGGINRNWTLADVRRQIEDADVIPLVYERAGQIWAFFLVRKERLFSAYPTPEERLLRPAWRLYLWIVKSGLPLAQYKAGLDDLFDGAGGWFSRVSGWLCWGELPYDLIPARARNYLDNRFPEHYDRFDTNGVRWRAWVYEVP